MTHLVVSLVLGSALGVMAMALVIGGGRMTYAELSEAQAMRSRQFAEAQTDAMSVYCDAERDLKDLQAENAKLRSICAEVAYILFNLDVDYCGLCDRYSINHPCPVHMVKGGECLIESELRELGIEVDA